jgi:hypothetical protein
MLLPEGIQKITSATFVKLSNMKRFPSLDSRPVVDSEAALIIITIDQRNN